jgi:hypothetical protein
MLTQALQDAAGSGENLTGKISDRVMKRLSLDRKALRFYVEHHALISAPLRGDLMELLR